jgi:predicted outer membrane repeat protein
MRRNSIAILLLTVGFAAVVRPVQGQTRILYVDANATGQNCGSSWGNAYQSLQDALANSKTLPEAVEIRVAGGAYRTPSMWVTRDIVLKGGYAGSTVPDPNVRDVNDYPTTLRLEGEGAEGIRVKDANVVIDSFIITGGSYRVDSRAAPGGVIWGGAGLCLSGADAKIANCTFVNNRAQTGCGGAVFVGPQCNIEITDSVFTDNYAGTDGGALCNSGGNIDLRRCVFTRNLALSSGGAIATLGGRISSEFCEFTKNTSKERGGGIYCEDSSPIVKDCVIIGNVASCGGGIAAYESSTQVENCVIEGNTASRAGEGAGGGIALYRGNARVLNCLVIGNIAASAGGGIVCSQGNYEIVNCTVSSNRVGHQTRVGEGGGGICFGPDGDNKSYLRNSIVWDNYVGGRGENDVGLPDNGILWVMGLTIEHSLIGEDPNALYDPDKRVTGSWIKGDPRFAVPGHWDPNGTPNDVADDFWVEGDYHVKSEAGRWDPNGRSWVMDDVTSPCVDAGDPNSDWAAEPWPNGGRINMGAYGGTAEASKSLSVVGNPDDVNSTPSQGPLRIRLGKGASWAGEPNVYDANIAGYRVVGEIASLTMRARIDGLPTKLVLAIQTSPGMAPMLENFTFTAPCLRIQGEPFGTSGLACSTRANSTLPWQDAPAVDSNSCVTCAIVGDEVHVTFQPKAIELLRTECSVSWIDWYRR